jgi:hypothetical protein
LRGLGSKCIEHFGFRPHLTAGGPEAVLLAFHKLRMKEVGTGKQGSLTLSYPKAFIVPFKGQKVKMQNWSLTCSFTLERPFLTCGVDMGLCIVFLREYLKTYVS